jgi:alkylation response protein AidB-like acyl-CoA dehydrogenase
VLECDAPMYQDHARSGIDGEILERARRAAVEIAPRAREIESARRLPPAVVDALVQAGVFKLLVARAYGGAEASLATFVAVLEVLAAADGSAGWCAMIGASSGLMAGFLCPTTWRPRSMAPMTLSRAACSRPWAGPCRSRTDSG